MEFKGSWDKHLPLIEFSYNNNYHSTIKMDRYEALYGKKCRSPSCWLQAGEKLFVWPSLIQEITDKLEIVGERMLADQNRQNSYVNLKNRPMTFEVGN